MIHLNLIFTFESLKYQYNIFKINFVSLFINNNQISTIIIINHYHQQNFNFLNNFIQLNYHLL